ncbi:MAG: hypothetical protein QM730_03370 [Anaerolineales bacterium]
MSKTITRITFSVLISLLIIGGIYTTVLGAPLGIHKAGTHVVSGAMANLDHFRLSVADQSTFGAYDSLSPQQEGGHGCGDNQTSSPSD